MPFVYVEGEIPEGLGSFDSYQIYNCLDSAITAQLLPIMKQELNSNTSLTYQRELRINSLCLEMSSKGFPIDQMCLAELAFDLERDAAKVLRFLHLFCEAVGFRAINPRSPKDVPDLFYSHLRIPPIWEHNRTTGTRKLSADIKAMQKIKTNYPYAAPFVNAIQAYRECKKMASVFNRGLEPDTGNLRCNYSQGTETGRLSSQQNPYGRATNGQNLTDRIRQVIAAPKGFAILNFDLKTAESFCVGYISGDRAYINACAGDLHTQVARMVWPSLPWTGDRKADRAVAETPFYRHFSHRDTTKKGGHGSNYYGTPRTLAGILNIPLNIVESFQRQYFAAFPGISDWHNLTIAKVQQDHRIITALGRERQFWGRSDDAATWREAIAYEPQSLVGDIMNEGLINVQQWIIKHLPEARMGLNRQQRLLPFNPKVPDLRAQIHDAGVFIVPIDGVAEIAATLSKLLEYPVDFGAMGTMLIPNDVTWGKRLNKRPKKGEGYLMEGLTDYTPGLAPHWDDR